MCFHGEHDSIFSCPPLSVSPVRRSSMWLDRADVALGIAARGHAELQRAHPEEEKAVARIELGMSPALEILESFYCSLRAAL